MRRAIYMISIDGMNVTSNFDPVLISLNFSITDGGESDTLDISLDDSYGRIQMPRVGAQIQATLAWGDGGGAVFFEGVTDEPKSEGSRDGGRILTITARATDMEGKNKEKKQAHEDDKKFGDVAEKWGKKAGLEVKVDDELKSVKRKFWAMQNESFMSWGQRMAEELGATFKIMGKKAVFVPRNSGKSVSGKELQPVMVMYGDNLISWTLAPLQSRPIYEDANVRWYDPEEAKWVVEKEKIASGMTGAMIGAGSSTTVPFFATKKAATKDNAKRKAKADAEETKRGKGGGSVVVDGLPAAQAQAPCIIMGIREGIDGEYRVTSAKHSYSRDDGWTTSLELENPQKQNEKQATNTTNSAATTAT